MLLLHSFNIYFLVAIIFIYKQAHFSNPPQGIGGGLNNGGLNPRYIKTQKLQKYKKQNIKHT
jgi:hypothetical protein